MNAGRGLVVCGILNFLFAVFHMLFPWMFAWSDDLESITPTNQAILYTFHSAMVFVLLAFAFLSIFRRDELLSTRLGRDILLMIGGVWLIRSIAEVVFFRIGADGAVWRLAIFLMLSLAYISIAIKISRTGPIDYRLDHRKSGEADLTNLPQYK